MDFYDKCGVKIQPGHILYCSADNSYHLVHETQTSSGDCSLGITATNPDFLKHHPDADIEFYGLSEFSTDDTFEVVNHLDCPTDELRSLLELDSILKGRGGKLCWKVDTVCMDIFCPVCNKHLDIPEKLPEFCPFCHQRLYGGSLQ